MASLRHRPRCSLGAEPISCRNGAAESCAGRRGGGGAQGARGAGRHGLVADAAVPAGAAECPHVLRLPAARFAWRQGLSAQ